MKNENISMRQVMTLLYIALLALGAEAIPGMAGANPAAILAPLLALLPVLLLLFLTFRHSEKERRLDLGQGLVLLWGRALGRLFALIFLFWGLFLLVVNVARCARRLTVAGGTPIFFSAVVLLLAVWMARGRLPAFLRACEIFYLAMGAGLLGIIILASIRLKPSYLVLLTLEDVKAVPSLALSILGVCSVGLYALFLAGDVTVRPGDQSRCYRWSAALFITLSVLLIQIFGTFGAPLVGRMQGPFFQMVAALGLTGAFQRLEALISTLWMLGDIALLGLLLFASKRLGGVITGKKESRGFLYFAGGASLIGGVLLAQEGGLLRYCQEVILPLGSILTGLLLLLFYLAATRKKRKGQRAAPAPQ